MTIRYGSPVYAPFVAGGNDQDDVAVAYGDQLGRTIHHFKDSNDRLQFSMTYKSRLYKSLCVSKEGPNGELKWFEWSGINEDGSDGQWVEMVSNDGLTLSTTDGTEIDDLSKIVIQDSEITKTSEGTANLKIKHRVNVSNGVDQTVTAGSLVFPDATITEEADQNTVTINLSHSSSGIEVDDGLTNQVDVRKISTTSMGVAPVSNTEVNLEPYITIAELGSSTSTPLEINKMKLAYPLQYNNDPDESKGAIVELQKGIYEPMGPPGYLAYYNDDAIVKAAEKTGDATIVNLWFNDVIAPSGPYIEIKRNTKTFGLQEADELDPNVSGGTNYLLAFRVAFKGIAPNYGHVTIGLYDNANGEYLKDINATPLVVEQVFQKDETLTEMLLIGIVNAKGLIEFTCRLEHSWVDYDLVLSDFSENPTGLLIQAITTENKTSKALLQFEEDIGKGIEFTSHYYGNNVADIKYALENMDIPNTEIPVNHNLVTHSDFHFHNASKMNVSVEKDLSLNQNLFSFSDTGDGTKVDFNIGRILSGEMSGLFRGHTATARAVFYNTSTDPNQKYSLGAYKWVGEEDQYTQDIILSIDDNGEVTLADNWVLIKEENAILPPALPTPNNAEMSFFVPNDVIHLAIIVYPTIPSSPSSGQIADVSIDADPAFTNYAINAPKEKGSLHLKHSDRFAHFRWETNKWENYASISTTGYEIYAGHKISGEAGDIVAVEQGRFGFTDNGKATINAKVWVYPKLNIVGTTTILRLAWFVYRVNTNSWSEIPNSSKEIRIQQGGEKMLVTTPEIKIDFNSGDKMILKAFSSVNDAVEIRFGSNPAVNNYCADYTFEIDNYLLLPDPFFAVDLSQFDKVYPHMLTATKFVSNVSGQTFNIDVPDDCNLSVIEAVKQLADSSIRPVKTLDWTYNNTNKTLTVSFGETITTGAITLGLYRS